MASGGIPAYIGKSSSTRNGLLKGPLQGGTVDAWEYDQGAPAPAFPAFRFTARRARIDWRILYGVDVHAIVSLALGRPQGSTPDQLHAPCTATDSSIVLSNSKIVLSFSLQARRVWRA